MFRRLYFPNEANPGGLHFGMFATAMENLAEPQLKEKWMPKMVTCEILGTYAQTEMGHGINVFYVHVLIFTSLSRWLEFCM